MRLQDCCCGLTYICRLRGNSEHPVRLVVDHGETSVAGDGEDTVAHTGDDLPEEGIVYSHGRRGQTGTR